MSRYEFRLASPEDDGELRALLAASPMDGGISVGFSREPSYFAAAEIDGVSVQVVTVHDRQTNRLIGMGSRSTQDRYVNGRLTPIGYLSGLRLLPEYRGQARLLLRGYRFFRELHRDGKAPYYLSTIASNNAAAKRLLTAGRVGMPRYSSLGRFLTFAVGPTKRRPIDESLVIRAATQSDAKAITEFLAAYGSTRDFFPHYTAADLSSDRGLLRGLGFESILLAERLGTIVGTLAVWDQRSFKQTRLLSYPAWLRLSRPVYNAVARWRETPELPPVGQPIDSNYAALFVVQGNERHAASSLLFAGRQLVGRRGVSALLVGLHETDPLTRAVQSVAGYRYVTDLYVVNWESESPHLTARMRRTPYLEVGSL